MGRRSVVLCLLVALSLCCLFLVSPAPASAAEEDVATTVNIFNSDGTLWQTLSITGSDTSDYWIYFQMVGGDPGFYALYLTEGVYPSDNVDSFTFQTLPDEEVGFSGDFSLGVDKMYPLTAGSTYNITFSVQMTDTPFLELFSQFGDLITGLIDRLGSAISEFLDVLSSSLDFTAFGYFADFLSGIWYSLPSKVRVYLGFATAAVVFSPIIWKGGLS